MCSGHTRDNTRNGSECMPRMWARETGPCRPYALPEHHYRRDSARVREHAARSRSATVAIGRSTRHYGPEEPPPYRCGQGASGRATCRGSAGDAPPLPFAADQLDQSLGPTRYRSRGGAASEQDDPGCGRPESEGLGHLGQDERIPMSLPPCPACRSRRLFILKLSPSDPRRAAARVRIRSIPAIDLPPHRAG